MKGSASLVNASKLFGSGSLAASSQSSMHFSRFVSCSPLGLPVGRSRNSCPRTRRQTAALVAGRKINVMGFRSFVNERRRLGILAVEAAKGLSGADLAARKSHGFKGPLIAELGLPVWLPGCGWILRVLFFRILFGHKARPTRRRDHSNLRQSTTKQRRRCCHS